MKKTYISPISEVIRIQTNGMLASSPVAPLSGSQSNENALAPEFFFDE